MLHVVSSVKDTKLVINSDEVSNDIIRKISLSRRGSEKKGWSDDSAKNQWFDDSGKNLWFEDFS